MNTITSRRDGVLRRFVLTVLLLSGCATYSPAPVYPEIRTAWGQSCVAVYNTLFEATHSTRDAQHHPIPGYPFLRSNRFLASFSPAAAEPAVLIELLRQQNRLARESLLIEWQNLPPRERERTAFTEAQTLADTLASCGQQLVATLAEDAAGLRGLEQRKSVPDNYSSWARVFGFYPLVAPVFRNAVAVDQREAERLSGQLLERWKESPETFQLYRWPAVEPAPSPLPAAKLNALGQPQLSETQYQQLFAKHAPAWLVETRSDSDRIGTLRLAAEREPRVDLSSASVYTALTWGRFQGQTTVQLNYVVWFPERPSQGRFDLLAGQLDSVMWRVHLSAGGEVLAYDSVHSCGCWYKFWPGPGFTADPPSGFYTEPVWVGPPIEQQQTLLLVSAAEHQPAPARMDTNGAGAAFHQLTVKTYDSLRSMSLNGERESLFDDNGLVPASRRPERFFFWPMGVASAGAMRQLGNHAIAFVGRRHFDDAKLLEEIGLQPLLP